MLIKCYWKFKKCKELWFDRDQIYFVDKGRDNGVSELYSLVDYSPRKDENIYKAYILGKYGAIPIL